MLLLAFLVAAPPQVVSLNVLNSKPDQYLGSVVRTDATLLPGAEAVAGKSVLMVGDGRTKFENVRLVLSPGLAAGLAAVTSNGPIRVVGTVVAPSSPNGPYGIEVDEIMPLNADGTAGAAVKAVVLPSAVKPAPVVASSAPLAAETPKDDGPPLGTIIPIVAAVVVGLVVVAFVIIRKRRAKAAEPPPPTRSVSERLNRRVK